MNERQIAQIKKQVELLNNNTETIELPKNYMIGIRQDMTALAEIAASIEARADFALRGIELSKEGFVAIHKDIKEIIEMKG